MKEKWPVILIQRSIVGCVAFSLYVLSMAPVTRLILHGRLPQYLSVPYRPLIWATQFVPEPMSETLVWYNSLWGV